MRLKIGQVENYNLKLRKVVCGSEVLDVSIKIRADNV